MAHYIVHLNEEQQRKLIILTESQESKSISAAKKLVMQRLGYSEQDADEFVRVKLRGDLPALRTPEGGKFILGATRMFVNGELRDANIIVNLNATLKLIASEAHINEYDRNLNGESARTLIDRFKGARGSIISKTMETLNSMSFDGPSRYNIVRIDSFKEARQYGQYTSWCVTHYENMFDNYTCDGMNQFYFCLRDGFEDEPEVPGEGCPLDDYGLSMVAVCVDGDGALSTCTCRWNHDNDGNDNIMDEIEVSKLIGQNFFSVFKPNTKWQDGIAAIMSQIEKRETITVENCRVYGYRDLDSKGYCIVAYVGKCNIVTSDNRLLSEEWFDNIDDFHEGWAKVKKGVRQNFINMDGQFLLKEPATEVSNFENGFAQVCYYNVDQDYYDEEDIADADADDFSYNLVRTDGSFLLNEPAEFIDLPREGWSLYKYDNEYNFINDKRELISDTWFRFAYSFSDGLAQVAICDKNGAIVQNFIDTDGVPICDTWFYKVRSIQQGNIVAMVETSRGKCNLVGTNRLLMLPEYVDYVLVVSDTCVLIAKNSKGWMVLDEEMNPRYNEWFSDIRDYTSQYIDYEGDHVLSIGAVVRRGYGEDEKYNIIDRDGSLMLRIWMDDLKSFNFGYALVRLNGKFNFIDAYGQLASNEWFDEAQEISTFCKIYYNGYSYKGIQMSEPVSIVCIGNKFNILLAESMTYVSDVWFDKMPKLTDHHNLEVSVNGKTMYLNRFLEWTEDVEAEGPTALRMARRRVSENTSRLIHLTESQQERLFLIEATVQEIFDKYYSDIPYVTFLEIIHADPTYSADHPDKMGKYGKWLLSMYKKGQISPDDLNGVRKYLSIFVTESRFKEAHGL